VRVPRGVVALAARNRRRVPPRVVGAVMEVLSVLDRGPTTRRPLLVLPSVPRVLAIAPHPDDETIGCGGTLARFAAVGATVEVVLVTDGGATLTARRATQTIRSQRREEARAACAILGLGAPRCLGLPDGEVGAHLPQLAQALQEAILEVQPDLLLAPWVLDAHPDHRAVSHALAHLVSQGRFDLEVADTALSRVPELWGYEAHTPIPLPDRVIDITEVLDRKQAALQVHTTAGRAFELSAALALNQWRSLATRAGLGAAEAFLTQPLPKLPACIDRAEQALGPLIEPRVERD